MIKKLCALILAATAPAFAHAATLGISVTNVPDATGTIRVAVCTKAEFLSPDCAYHNLAPAHAGRVRVSISGIRPGVYAVQVFQDRNGNGKLDRSFLGMPREPIGFSRDPAMRFGPPSFADSAVTIGDKDGELSLTLRTK